ncbi:hypothetical protein CBR_g50655 [Chara braunii]|uniref:Uncharacterized protein n=1 Tax=Chara braunii TaxID=69332 RepID=A0A388M739_CHABU|nr:hypothetical protein CBR_g50655 [Chara braunii]|eukprot:GBG90407.1 hypothetical protein CBR_g50655 [Chara braunii]
MDKPANEQRDDREWKVLRALANNNFIHFVEPCIIECHDDPAVKDNDADAEHNRDDSTSGVDWCNECMGAAAAANDRTEVQ